MNARNAVQSSPSRDALTRQPRALARNRRLLIAGVVTVLPASAIVPSLLDNARSPAMLAAVEEMATLTHVASNVNERAVERANAEPVAAEAAVAPAEVEGETPMIAIAPEAPVETRMFNGRLIRPATTMSMLVTAYSPDERSCGEFADGITASGYSVWTNGMKLVAADTTLLPFGTLVSVPGYDNGEVVPVLDRGGAIKGHRLDVLYPTHERALKWGAQRLEVTVWEYVDELPSDFVIAHR